MSLSRSYRILPLKLLWDAVEKQTGRQIDSFACVSLADALFKHCLSFSVE